MVIQAIVDLYDNGEAASVRANKLKTLGWQVVLSGPNDGTDLQINGGLPEPHDQGWVVLASKTSIDPA